MKNKIEITEDAQNYIDSLIKKDKFDYFRITVPVSYTHLTLPTICSV